MFFEAHNLSLLIEGEQVMLFLFLGKNQTLKQPKRFYMLTAQRATTAHTQFFEQDQYGV